MKHRLCIHSSWAQLLAPQDSGAKQSQRQAPSLVHSPEPRARRRAWGTCRCVGLGPSSSGAGCSVGKGPGEGVVMEQGRCSEVVSSRPLTSRNPGSLEVLPTRLRLEGGAAGIQARKRE